MIKRILGSVGYKSSSAWPTICQAEC